MSKRQAKATKPTDAETITALREPNPAEVRGIAAAKARRAERDAPPAVSTVRAKGTMRTFPRHRDHSGWVAHIEDAFGTCSAPFAEVSLTQLETLLRPSGSKAEPATDQRLNYALALVAGVQAKDEVEAALGVQLAAAHTLSMEFLGRAAFADHSAKAEAYTTMATKLSRTMIAAAEAIAKLRPRDPQRIEVIYVNGPANFGTQAVVHAPGTGGQAGRAALSFEQPHGLDASRPPMRGQDAARYVMPGTRDPEPEAVQISRGDEPRSADREG